MGSIGGYVFTTYTLGLSANSQEALSMCMNVKVS